LGPEREALQRLLEDELPQKIRSILKEQFADQKAIEIETTELIAERALRWAKTFGFFVGIPISLLVIFLGFLGLKTWSDITTAQNTLSTALANLSTAQQQLNTANEKTHDAITQATAFQNQLKDAQDSLKAIPAIQQKQQELEKTFNSFVYRSKANIPSNVQSQIDDIVTNYKQYLVSVGIDIPNKLPVFSPVDDLVATKNALSYYDSSENAVVIDSKIVNAPSIWLRDFTHQVIFGQVSWLNLPKQEVSAMFPIESPIATYLPCSFLNDPKVGAPSIPEYATLENLDQNTDFSKLPKQYEQFESDPIIGAIFWSIRNKIGRNVADKALFAAFTNFLQHHSSISEQEFFRIYQKIFDSGAMTTPRVAAKVC